jgi:type IV pilus assembly protein PilB
MSTMETVRPDRSAPAPSRRLFGQVLVGAGLITQAQLDEALRVQRTLMPNLRLGQILVEQEVITRQQLSEALSREIGRSERRHRLGELLVEAGVISEDQLQSALRFQQRTGLRLGEALLQLDCLTESALKEALCGQLGVAFVRPDQLHVHPGLGSVISRRYAQRHRVVPISRVGDTLTVIMTDPANRELVRELQASTGLRISPVTTTQDGFHRAFTQVYG